MEKICSQTYPHKPWKAYILSNRSKICSHEANRQN
mgnify:CR=1 FL=1|jgi:hypothetical protein